MFGWLLEEPTHYGIMGHLGPPILATHMLSGCELAWTGWLNGGRDGCQVEFSHPASKGAARVISGPLQREEALAFIKRVITNG